MRCLQHINEDYKNPHMRVFLRLDFAKAFTRRELFALKASPKFMPHAF
ncbi:hypothetical protein GEAM_1213 [Ewingella americana ATCC 33852]|uniref:Uncharacterized protein n=1 Tax=Ewingella americana (strain ATCC 33852 / DSM 4580 / CCUG 14506 / JCM 5911 / LMG 7869 / NCTC 12157 / CDC 1468-78) TaxID=910964 RepID=A0A085GIN8_EWIA3|nr:hypothetical protein GEAM_1213 [Ewingella americana ATCC 33852]